MNNISVILDCSIRIFKIALKPAAYIEKAHVPVINGHLCV